MTRAQTLPLHPTTEGVPLLLDLLTYRRPSKTKAAEKFGRRFLAPVMGQPDSAGNYFTRIGGGGRVLFAAHYDTVHYQGGRQEVATQQGLAFLPDRSPSNCLGADCTTGVWLILEMIRAGLPGCYAVFADEEVGCHGSAAFAADRLDDLRGVDVVISLDRKGFNSIITHQTGKRTASDAFARSLADVLGMDMKPDSGGSFTDSNEFASVIAECTNISVGYLNQHTGKEVQDLDHAARLLDQMLAADWSALEVSRKPGDFDCQPWPDYSGWMVQTKSKKSKDGAKGKRADRFADTYPDPYRSPHDFDSVWDADRYGGDNLTELRRVVRDHPDAVASILDQLGVNVWDVLREVDGVPF